MNTYLVSLTERAEMDLEAIYLRQIRQSPERGARWYAGLLAAIDSLSSMPTRCPVAPEDARFPDVQVRQLIYGNRRSAYRILYFIIESDAGGEAGTVRVLRILHGAQRRINGPAIDPEEDPD